MLQLLCVCIFLGKYANGYHNSNFNNELTKKYENDDDLKRKVLSFLDQSSSWGTTDRQPHAGFGIQVESSFSKPIVIIRPPKIETTFRTELNVKQFSHPYLFRMMEMLPIKGKTSFEYVYQKLFQYYIALQQFQPLTQPLTKEQTIQILQKVFPELGDKIYTIASYPPGPPMLKELFSHILPGLSQQDLETIFRDARTNQDVINNLILYFCPNIRDHFLWKDDLPSDKKLNLIMDILFPGVKHSQNLQGDFHNNIFTTLDNLFQGKLIPSTVQEVKPEGPEWSNFQNYLHQNHLNLQAIPKETLYYLYSNYKTPHFNTYLNQLKEKVNQENPNKMDPQTLRVWLQYINDLKNHKTTLNNMPPEVKVFLEQQKNPQELIKTMSDSLGFPVDPSKLNIPLDPQVMDLWKKFIFDLVNHKGDTTHLPKPLLDYFNSLSKNPDYKSNLDKIFDTLSINPEMAVKWNNFFDKLRDGKTTLDEVPQDLQSYLINQQHPEEFLRLILKLKDADADTNFLNIDTNPDIMRLWKQFVQDVAENKGNIRNIPEDLLEYFYKIASDPAHRDYIKLLFAPNKVDPKTLTAWNRFINDLKAHQVDLKDMPPEIIQLMLKYKKPDDFFKVVLPQSNIKVAPNKEVEKQWKDLTANLPNHSVSIYDTPEELKDYFKHFVPSQDHQAIFDSIHPDLLAKWKQFRNDLEQHKKSLSTMPEDLKSYISWMKSPKDFVNLIFKGLDPPLNGPIPKPSKEEVLSWRNFLDDLQKERVVNGEVIRDGSVPADLTKYLRDASDDPNYKHDLNNIFQMDNDIKSGFEDFKRKMQQDYNVTLNDLPKKLRYFLRKFEDPIDALRSILAAYPGNYEIRKPLEEEDAETLHSKLSMSMPNITESDDESKISPEMKFVLKHYTIGTPLDNQIGEVIRLHEKNGLVKRLETFWKESKEEIPVHDGLEVFLRTLYKFGEHYFKAQELCEDRSQIIDALDTVKHYFKPRYGCYLVSEINKLKN